MQKLSIKHYNKPDLWVLISNNPTRFNPLIPVKLTAPIIQDKILNINNNNIYISFSVIYVLSNAEAKILNAIGKNIKLPDKYIAYFNPTTNEKIAYRCNDFYIKSGNYITVRVIPSPTSNCQLCTIPGAGDAFRRLITNKSINDFLLNVYSLVGKKLLFIDINREYVKQIKQEFGDYIILQSDYISSNGSHMCIMVINIYRYLKSPNKKTYNIKRYVEHEAAIASNWLEKYEVSNN